MAFSIATGRHVLQLMSLEQRRETLPFSGIPTREQAGQAIARALHRARAGASPVLLIEPEQRPLALASALDDDTPDDGDARILLPAVRCLGHFRSAPLDSRSGALHSELSILWWQDTWASPIDPDIRKAIAALDWHRHARDYTE